MLDFSDLSLSQFFAAELDADINDPIYAEHGGSKGKRLRCFLQKVDDATAARTLQALWEHRTELLARTGQQDPVINAESRYLTLLARLTGQPSGGTGEQIDGSFLLTDKTYLFDADIVRQPPARSTHSP